MLPAIKSLLSYSNQKVLNRYSRDYPDNQLKSDEAFAELMKYFWLSQKHKTEISVDPHNESLKFHCVIHKEMSDMDDMWHTFLLFTQDYLNFCMEFFDGYIHHTPIGEEEQKDLLLPDFELELNRYLSYIYDNLGQETVEKWFSSLLV
ncbi:Uncharacterized conserved protein [Legionella wadsworthii]|uniref:Uncharacterized conserved protein n=1 Tax=Legionella wadsworthii TaxID=28088 RepID=A0A378LV26_9GAMM|nr:hypothetical protein [Legionella wadsworthii]STY31323.1 Uncharacterized conserved protein [Legionella wadsworthii]